MNLSAIPMPGAFRLRTLHPLVDGSGSCSLIYDLERAAVFEVPSHLQLHVAAALETGDPDEELLSWLASEDLLTAERSDGDWDELEMRLAAGGLIVYRLDEEVHGWIDHTSEPEVVEALDLIFRRGLGAPHLEIHLGWVGRVPGDGLLDQILAEACRRAALAEQEVSYELTLEASQVTPALVRYLSRYPIHIRLRCGGHDPRDPKVTEDQPWLAAEGAVLLLLAEMPDQLTVQCVLDGPARVLELWSWAKRLGVRRLDTIRLVRSGECDRPTLLAREREFRDDLLAICDQMVSDLEMHRLSVDYQPLTRIIRRLMRSEPAVAFAGQRGAVVGTSWNSFPFPALEGLDPEAAVGGCGSAEAASAIPCQGCWARFICTHSAYVASPLGGNDPRERSDDTCSLWQTEADVALRLYHRLAQADPVQVLRLFEERFRLPAGSFAFREAIGSSKPS
ncbi:MAG: hypothetical protein M3O15_00260 [Acidobacteriota bacterium]|nr:hypothetical protein [Acidobacteriota bacterium]